MRWQLDPQTQFMPTAWESTYHRWGLRMLNYPGTYQSIMEKNDTGDPAWWMVNELSADSVNAYGLEVFGDSYHPLRQGWVYVGPGRPDYWEARVAYNWFPISHDDKIAYWQAMAYALVFGQMMCAMWVQQWYRVRVFGHYGRKRKPQED